MASAFGERGWPLAVGAGFLLLTLAWLPTNPPAAAPDEPDHYVRALAVGRGDWLGRATDRSSMAPSNERQAAYLRETNREVSVPAGMAAPPSWFCTQAPDTSAACLGDQRASGTTVQTTYEGTYLPFAYLPSGLLMRLASTPPPALLLGRAAIFVLCLPLLLAALAALWEPGSPLSLLGLLVAVTPTVVFSAAVLNPSGPEIAAAICLAACLIRLWRDQGETARGERDVDRPLIAAGGVAEADGARVVGGGSPSGTSWEAGGASCPGWVWVAIAVAGFVLAVSRPLGVGWIVLQLAVFVAMAGVAALRSSGRRGAVAAVVVLLGCALSVGWQVFIQAHSAPSPGTVLGFVPQSLAQLPEVLGEAVGVFGWQNVLMPRPLYLLGDGLLFLPFVVAVFRGSRRELNVLDLLVVAVIGTSVLVSAAVQLPTGFDAQGRHLLPVIVLLPLWAGEVINRHRATMSARGQAGLLLAVAAGVALIQVAGWWSNAHRWAVGPSGSWLFFLDARWQPAPGWGLWTPVAVLAAALPMVAAGAAWRSAAARADVAQVPA
jgi:hypothetical protein